ncbi:uncharacterized protein L199_004131 [Kwoniella botswanensis]|uniref:uncharacterized protein n=1 Tax=Kwoniella botswanensis TaxID=1268659 RepID=UPI00315C7E06
MGDSHSTDIQDQSIAQDSCPANDEPSNNTGSQGITTCYSPDAYRDTPEGYEYLNSARSEGGFTHYYSGPYGTTETSEAGTNPRS